MTGAAPRRAAFLDRDGTLIEDPGYLGDAARVALLPGAAEAVARLRRAGFAVVVVSNQSGVARGLFDEAAVHAVNRRMAELLLAADPEARIDAFYFCPHLPPELPGGAACDCRKPLPGLILRAARELDLDLGASVGIGDRARDAEAALAAGCAAALQIGAAPEPESLLAAVVGRLGL